MEQHTVDARGARLAVRTYLRWFWVPIVAAGLGYLVGSVFSSEGTVDSSKSEVTFTVGLTNEVRWPFFDAVLERQAGILEEQQLAAQAEQASGVQAENVGVSSTNVQNSTLTISADVLAGPDDAVRFAEVLGELLVEANRAEQQQTYREQALSLESQLADQEGQATVYEEEIEAFNEQWLALQDQIVVADPTEAAELRGRATQVDDQRRVTQRRLDAVVTLENQLRTQLTRTQFDVERTGSTVQISAAPSVTGQSSSDARPVTALVFVLAALLAVPLLDRMFGKVASVDHLGLIWPNARLVDTRSRLRRRGGIDPIAMVELALTQASGAGQKSVTIAELAPSPNGERITSALQRSGVDARLAGVDTASELTELVEADATALLVPAGSVRLRRAHWISHELELLGIVPSLIVLTSKSSDESAGDESSASRKSGEFGDVLAGAS